MKVLLCGGGTVGHITPAIAIAEALTECGENCEFLFVGRDGGDENREITKKGYPFKGIKINGFERKISIKNIKNVYTLIKAIEESKKILAEFMPDIVIGTGGYVSFPILRAAQKRGIPTVIHESNSTPGMVTRLLAPKCDKVLLNFKDTEDEYRKKDNLKIVGNPVRSGFFSVSKSEARKKLNVKNSEIFILSFGGSGGARNLNDCIIEVMKKYSQKKNNIKHIHASGKKYFAKLSEEIRRDAAKNGCSIKPYIEDMPLYLCAADIVISRCGAMSIAEISASAKAAILIPSPNVTNNHQYKNALHLKNNGAALVVEEKDLTAERLIDTIKELSENHEKRLLLEKNVSTFYVKDCKKQIAEEIKGVIRGRK